MHYKIAIFSSYFSPYIGGIERYIHSLSKNLAEKGNDIQVIVSNHCDLETHTIINGFELIRLPVFKLTRNRFPIIKPNLLFKIELKKILEFNPDIIIVNTRFFLTSALGVCIAKKLKRKIILIEHGSDHLKLPIPLFNKLSELYEHLISFFMKLNVDKFFGVSKSASSWLEHFKINSSGEIYNGISNDITADENFILPADSFNVVYAGRLLEQKGASYLAKAINQLSKTYPSIKLYIAGDGELFEKLKAEYSNNNSIILLGALDYPKVISLIRQAHIIAVPSYYPEGLPTIILEAGINSIAVVSTNQGGIKELIINNVSGIIVEPRSSNGLVNAIEELYLNKDKRILLGSNLNKIVNENYLWDRITENLLVKISDILGY